MKTFLKKSMPMLVLVLVSLLFLAFAHAQGASPSPSPTPVVTSTPPPASGSASTAGFVGIVLLILAVYNIVLSAAQDVLAALHVQVPAWMQTATSIGLTVAKYLGGNPNAGAQPVEAAQAKPSNGVS